MFASSRNMSVVASFAIVTVVAWSLGGCSGSGDGIIVDDVNQAFVGAITIQGVAAPVFTNGQPTMPQPPTGVAINARITFAFGAPIDPSSLPPEGPSIGSVRITEAVSGTPATGCWAVDDADPSIAFFYPFSPSTLAMPCASGLMPDTDYVIDIPDAAGGANQVVRLAGGTPLQTPAHAAFRTIACNPNSPMSAFVDVVPGSPTIVTTTPAASSSEPVTILSAIANTAGGSDVTVEFSEPLLPASLSGFRVANVTYEPNVVVQVVGTTIFFQTGTFCGPANRSRIVFSTPVPLVDGDTYEMTFTGVVDLGNNPLVVSNGPLRFMIQDQNDDVDQLFVDDFTTTANLATQVGAIDWSGTGRVVATFPTQLTGTGSDGAIVISTSMSINTNLNQGRVDSTSLTIGGTGPITLNYTSPSNIPAMATSDFGVHLRSLSTIDVSSGVTFACAGRAGSNGMQNSGLVAMFGGYGGPGGGAGGMASPVQSTTVASDFGLPGNGPSLDPANPSQPGGTPNTMLSNAFNGGGGGGLSGPPTTAGPSGGGGGTNSMMPPRGAPGESQQGTDLQGLGAPAGGAGGKVPLGSIPPLLVAFGGSGGGAGGDRLDVGGPPNQDTGGSGGGGGGALRLSAVGDISIGQLSALNCTGGNGGTSQNLLTAKGGGGSGGTILIQSFANVNMGAGIQLLCGGGLPSSGSPTPLNPPSSPPNGDGGVGGQGVIQIQDADGIVAGFSSALVVGEMFVGIFPFVGSVMGQATSALIDSSSPSPKYVLSNTLGSSMAATSNGVNGAATVQVVGVAEDPANPGSPGTGMGLVSAPVPIAQIASLSGYRWIRFECSTSFPAPPATSLGQALPEVQMVSIAYRR